MRGSNRCAAASTRTTKTVRRPHPPGEKDAVLAFVDEADARVVDALRHDDLERPGDPLLDRADAVFTILEHEAMHQETLLYMWHRLPFSQKRRPAGYAPRTGAAVPADEWRDVSAGTAMLGADRSSLVFGWDNEQPSCVADVAGFQIQRHDVTNARYMEFVDAGGYADARWWRPEDWQWAQNERLSHPLFWERVDGQWFWRGMFELIPLPPSWPVYVSQAEASAYARWRGWRLPTEAEYQRAATGAAPGLCDFSSWDPEPVGSHPDGASEFGVDDLVGNGWEWTSSPFGPFPGFHASASYPEYSADFFDGQHGDQRRLRRRELRPTFRKLVPRASARLRAFRCVRSSPRSPVINKIAMGGTRAVSSDVQHYLSLRRQLPPLFDESARADAICRLPGHGVTRAELRLSRDLWPTDLARCWIDDDHRAGPGNGETRRSSTQGAPTASRPPAVDISASAEL